VRIILLFIIICTSVFLTGARYSSDSDVDNYTAYQNNLFVTAAGLTTGDCSTWGKACTFRTALALCTDDVQDILWMSPEDHDTDNGSDGTGTDVTVKNVRIIGAGASHQLSTRFFNGHATASIVLTLSGHRVSLENIRFTQESKPDVNVTYINITGNRSLINTCDIKSATGAASDIGILYSGGSQYHYVYHVHLRSLQDAGIRLAESDHIEFDELFFEANIIGMDFTDIDDGPFLISNALFKGCTSGVEIAAGVVGVAFSSPLFLGCAANVGSVGDYDVLHIDNFRAAHALVGVYPADAGVTVVGAAGAYAQGNLTEIIPASTLVTPFTLQGINVQSASATDVIKIEIFYGVSSASNVSLGIFEFYSDRKTGIDISGLNVSTIPANSYVGAKVASKTGGADNVVITLSYKATN